MLSELLAILAALPVLEKAIGVSIAVVLGVLGIYLAHLYARSFTGFAVTEVVTLAIGVAAGFYLAKRGFVFGKLRRT